MPLYQTRVANFGSNRANATGSTGVGYTLLGPSGSITAPRTTSGVFQLVSGSGIYAAEILFPDSFRGQVLWDTGDAFPTRSYASEQFNIEENNPAVDLTFQAVVDIADTVNELYNIAYGRWKIDKDSSQMVFYGPDNVTEVARFNLFDDQGQATFDSVFERRRV